MMNKLGTKQTDQQKIPHKRVSSDKELTPPNCLGDNGDKLNLMLAPTSDYWSTVNSGSDYYKQQLVQQVPAQPMLHFRPLQSSPLLAGSADQEYYLDVASVAQNHVLDPHEAHLTTSHHHHHHHLDHLNHLQQQQQQFELMQNITQPMNPNAQLLQQQQQLPQFPAQDEEDYDDYAVPSDENCRLDRSQVELVQMIGEGQKGYVFLGKLQSKDGRSISDVAIKTLKYETDQLIEKLMREAAMMRQFEHPHIIKFIGVCPETPALIAMELAEFGEVKCYLKLNKHLISSSQLVLFTFQISTALSYLESKQYVHRDVAARNVLVCSHSCVKLADFGLSRNLQLSQQQQTDLFLLNHWKPLPAKQQDNTQMEEAEGQQYVAAAKGKLPVRWLAPESLAFRRFTSASDVWMFAVCSWEFFQFGQVRPWAHIRNNQVLLAIESGQRLAQPAHCPARLYQLMLRCWSYAPVQRPKFRELKQQLWSIYLNERAKEQLELEQQHQQLQQHQQHQLQLRHQQLQLQLQLQQQQISPQRGQLPPDQPVELPEERLAAMMRRSGQRQGQHWAQPQRQAPTQNHLLLEPTGANEHSSASPMLTNYSSNISGYSSAGAGEHSLNSSRSSSMGSFARHRPVAVEPQPRPAPQSPAGRPPEVAASPTQRPERAKIDENMRRFQRPNGHMLQKQRSQGSIVSQPQSAGSNLYVRPPSWQQQQQQFGFDDGHAMGCLRRRARRPKSELQLAQQSPTPADNYYEEDDEDDEDSSEPETTRPSHKSSLEAASAQLVAQRLDHLSLEPSRRRLEGAYDGIPGPGEVAMLRGTSDAMASNKKRPPSDRDERLAREAERMHEQKLADVIESLKIAPMKAKLSYKTNAGPGTPAHRLPAALTKTTSQSPEVAVNPELDERAEEEQRQLALHRRLLGHIRPASRTSGHRHSAKLLEQAAAAASGSPSTQQQQQQAPGTPKEIVDQSLQLLESLIAEKRPRFKGPTIHDRQVRAAQTSVAQIAEFQQQQSRAQGRTHHQTRPKSVSHPRTSLNSAYFSRSP